MAMRYWNGYSWRRISDVEARFRRAHGQEVVEVPGPVEPPTPERLPVIPLEALPPAPMQVHDWPVPPPPVIEHAEHSAHEASDGVAVDLTDDELERLTAPGAGSEG